MNDQPDRNDQSEVVTRINHPCMSVSSSFEQAFLKAPDDHHQSVYLAQSTSFDKYFSVSTFYYQLWHERSHQQRRSEQGIRVQADGCRCEQAGSSRSDNFIRRTENLVSLSGAGCKTISFGSAEMRAQSSDSRERP